MVNIGDLLSNSSQLSDLLLGAVEEGDVYRFRLTPQEGVIPKNVGDIERNKYFIVIGKDKEGNAFGFVLINTRVNPHLPECRRNLHYLLRASDYEFLNGQDRYVDCSDFKKISKERFSEVFSGEKMKGCIKEEDLIAIKRAICSYENVSMKLLKRFGLVRE